jgi:hypothetical protein
MNAGPIWGGDHPVWVGAVCLHKCWPALVQIVPVVVDGEVGQVRSRVELFEQIRRDRRREDLSIRELGRPSRRAPVRQALVSAVPAPARPARRGRGRQSTGSHR